MEAEKQDAACIIWCFYFPSSCKDAAKAVENHQRTRVAHACESEGLNLPRGSFAPFPNSAHLTAHYFHK